MTAFWIAAGLLTLLILAILCTPLLRRHASGSTSRKALNAAIYRDQIADLERDQKSGTLSQDDYATARDELERRVLEDLSQDDAAAPTASTRRPLSAIALAIALPAAAVALYLILGNPAALDPEAHSAGMAAGAAPTQAEVEQMVAKLAAKLEKSPDNPEGWVMLGRSYKAMGRFDEAARAFDKAGVVMESEPVLMLELAELSAEQNEGRIDGKALLLLQQVLKDQPDNPQALVLAGSNAYFRKDYAGAVSYWERLLTQVAPDSQDAQNLAAGIAKARSMMGRDGKLPPPSAPFAAAEAPAPAAAPAAAAASGASLRGRVDLDPSLKAKAGADDTVFIFARAVQGPRIPLAVLRVKVADLPLDFKLDDSMAMSPELKLSSVSEVRVEARISKSGNAIASPGDLSGSAGPVKPDASGLLLHIDQVVK